MDRKGVPFPPYLRVIKRRRGNGNIVAFHSGGQVASANAEQVLRTVHYITHRSRAGASVKYAQKYSLRWYQLSRPEKNIMGSNGLHVNRRSENKCLVKMFEHIFTEATIAGKFHLAPRLGGLPESA